MTLDIINEFIDKGVFTPETIDLLKDRYTKAMKTLIDGSKYLQKHEGTKTYDQNCMFWYISCALPFGGYYKILDALKKKGIIDYTDEEITTAWYKCDPVSNLVEVVINLKSK